MSDIWHLETRHLGRRVLVFDRLDSTNTYALQLADADGVAILADEQTAGRGQHGRRWLAPPRSSVLLSVLLPPTVTRPALLTAWAAVSVADVVRQLTGPVPRIKWPNDVLVTDRKICGILIEQSRHPAGPVTVAGIGLNVTQTAADFAAAGLPEATSLAALDAHHDTHAVARLLLTRLDDNFTALADGSLERRWRDYLDLEGHAVEVELSDRRLRGQLVACGFDRLTVATADERTHVAPEAVLHIRRCE